MSEERVYTQDEIGPALESAGLEKWSAGDNVIRRKIETDGWATTLMLATTIGFLCEAAWHHADLHLSWGAVGVEVSTHSAGGVTDKDLELARRIEDVALWRPAADDALEGTTADFVKG
jgi:pterin-4a-carbinolamine dehydratase